MTDPSALRNRWEYLVTIWFEWSLITRRIAWKWYYVRDAGWKMRELLTRLAEWTDIVPLGTLCDALRSLSPVRSKISFAQAVLDCCQSRFSIDRISSPINCQGGRKNSLLLADLTLCSRASIAHNDGSCRLRLCDHKFNDSHVEYLNIFTMLSANNGWQGHNMGLRQTCLDPAVADILWPICLLALWYAMPS